MEFVYVILGLAFGGFLTWLFLVFKRKHVVRNDVEIVMSQLRKVNKLVTVEGEFSEIYKHEEKKAVLFNLFDTEKKAIIIIKAKVMMGYDLAKMKYEVDAINKRIKIIHKPKPEILNIWTDAEYYDIKTNLLTKFSKDDLNKIKNEATDFLLKKINESDLPKLAENQANIGFSLLEDTTKSLGWSLKY